MSNSFRILHVDDDPDFADVTAEFLEHENDRFEVVTETRPAVALDCLDDDTFDCVVSDYQMPRMDGLEFLDAVREEFPDLPFILFTNHGSEQVAATAVEKGVTSYLQKEAGGTTKYAMLANRIRTHVEKYRAERRARRLEREYELIARTASDMFWTFDHSTRTVWFSDGIQHFGYDPDRIDQRVGVDWLFERIHPDDRERICDRQDVFRPWDESAFGELLHEGETPSIELRFRRADGSYADCRARGVAVVEDGEPSKIVGTLTDITERKQRQRELEETTEKLEAIIEASPDAINVIDEDGNVEVWNPAAEEMFGWTEEAVVGEPLPIVPDEMESEFRKFRGELFDEEPQPVAGYETQRKRKDGMVIDVSISTAPIRDTDGEVFGTMAVIEDITERKERQRRLDALSEAFPDIAFLIDEEGRHLELLASPASEELLYTDADEMLGRRLHDLFPAEKADELLSSVRTTLETGRQQTLEYELEVPAGARQFEARTTPLPAEIGDERVVVWVARDITERKEREREFRQYEGIVREMNDGVVVVHDGIIRDTNPQISEMIGYSPEELREEPMTEFIAPDDRETVSRRHRQRVAGEEPPKTYEIGIVSKDGETIPVEITAARVEYEEQPATVSIVRDISERKARERELERQNDRLEELARIVSHDLRNPLNVAEGRLTLAQDECDSEHLDDVEQAHDRMNRLIEDLLTLAREGETPTEVAPVDLADLAEASWQNVETGPATLAIETNRTIRADRSRLTQVFENLIRNAVEHGSTSSRTESGDSVAQAGADVTVTVGALDDGFYVEDDGPGIDPDERDRVFESGYSTTEEGTGFGLSIVREIVDAHGWDVRITDGPDGGARFEIIGVDSATSES